MKFKSLPLIAIFAFVASALLKAQAPAPQFKTPAAVGAKLRYDQSATLATQQYLRELDAAMKSAMQFNNLEEANLIASVGKAISASGTGDGDFKSAPAKSAKSRYAQALSAAKKLYSRELEGAGKSAMAASNLDEANAINAKRTQLDEEVKSLGGGAGITASGFGSPSSATKPGLLVKEYPRNASQSDPGHANLALESMGEPLKKTFTIRSLTEWKYDEKRNAVASGFIRIEKDGEYAFNSNSFYDRNMLMVDGHVVCRYADGEQTVATITLKAGMVPIISVGYVDARGSAKVIWQPPGQKELGEIPGKLLFH